MRERDAVAEIMKTGSAGSKRPGELRMRPEQEQGIARILAGMGYDDEGPEVADLVYRVGASPHAWRWRVLTVAQANSVLEMLGRFYESRARPT
jgi:hypothetical protein